MKQWITGIFAASLLGAIAMTLCPEGRVRSVTRMVCGLVCALAVASPVVNLDLGDLAAGFAAYGQQAQKITQDAEEEEKMLERTYIEEQYAAYILAEAAQLGADVTEASVLARWDDSALVWFPWEASMDGRFNAALSRVIEEQLGVPLERQGWSGDE